MRWKLTILLGLLQMAALALAQSNSLLHARPAPAGPPPSPEVQPAIMPSMGINARPPDAGVTALGEAPPQNEVLLAASPFAVAPPEPRHIVVNDLVTVIVRESRTSTNDAKMKSEKDWRMESELAKWFRLDPEDRLVPQTFPNGTPGIDFEFRNSYEGKGKYDRKDELTTRITARVIDVKPNGNVVLEARKRIEIGDEILIATLTGECRSLDISAQNTVLSTQIADLEITLPDRGAVRDATRRGWLMRAFDLLRPI